MGVPCDKDLYTPLCPHTGETLFTPTSQMKYDTSWDWLMPVVQKCFEVAKHEDDFFAISGSLPYMDSTYDAVVEFIKEHNG